MKLYHKPYKLQCPKCLILFGFFLFTFSIHAQENSADSVAAPQQDTLQIKTFNMNNIIRSALIPGWGQIRQERPGRAVFFYGFFMHFAHNIIYHSYRDSKRSELKLRQNAMLISQVYILNMIDVLHTELYAVDKSWYDQMFSDTPLKSPWGAVARSAMLPGWGQFYNEKYIKSVVSLGLISWFSYQVILNNRKYKDTGNKIYLSRRSEKSWQLGLVYALNMVDAYVDAYLYKFDEMMELTTAYDAYNKSLMLGIMINF